MKIFLDANIIVAILNKEFPLFSLAARIISLNEGSNFSLYTSPLCLAIAFYFAEKKSGSTTALKKITLLASKINIAQTGAEEVSQTITNKQIIDFEDGLEYYSAINAGCSIIITEEIEDFYFAEIRILNCLQFFETYLRKK